MDSLEKPDNQSRQINEGSEEAATCYGYTSITKDGRHVILTDWDDQTPDEIIPAINNVIHKYALGEFYLLKSERRKSYHCISPTKVTYEEYLRIAEELVEHGMDENFLYPLKNWEAPMTTLRFFSPVKGNMEYVKKIRTPYQPMYSTPHLSFFKNIFNINVPTFPKDHHKDLMLVRYETQKTGGVRCQRTQKPQNKNSTNYGAESTTTSQ